MVQHGLLTSRHGPPRPPAPGRVADAATHSAPPGAVSSSAVESYGPAFRPCSVSGRCRESGSGVRGGIQGPRPRSMVLGPQRSIPLRPEHANAGTNPQLIRADDMGASRGGEPETSRRPRRPPLSTDTARTVAAAGAHSSTRSSMFEVMPRLRSFNKATAGPRSSPEPTIIQ